MDKVKRIIISLSIVFISFLLIDGGKTIMLFGTNIQILLSHEHNNDLEIPHQHNLNKFADDEKWIKSNSFELLCSSNKPVLFMHYLNNINSEDYTGSVWQPPKSQ
jgi:hypothetical protein